MPRTSEPAFARFGLAGAALAGAALACAALVACAEAPGRQAAPQPAEDITVAQTRSFQNPVGSDPVVTAVQSASSYLADPPGRLGGHPALAAQVVAQYEFATVALKDLRFIWLNPLTQILMDQGRVALRGTLGIRQDAPSQAVIERMTTLSAALGRGDGAAAESAASGGVFTKPAPVLLATLNAMPAVPAAGRAAGFAEQQLNRPDGVFFKR